MDQRVSDNIEFIALAAIAGLLFVDVFLDISKYFPNGWFHLLLGISLVTIGVILFINRDEISEK